MFVRRGPLRHARMLVAATYAADKPDGLAVVPAPEQPLVPLVPLGDGPAEVVRLSGPDLLAGPPLPDGPRDLGA